MISFPKIDAGPTAAGKYVEAVFWSSPQMQKCLRVFQQELRTKLEIADSATDFFGQLTMQLKLFGYAVFRKRSHGVEVLSGTAFTLERDPKTFEIRPVLAETHKRTRGWHMIMTDPPSFAADGALLHCRGSGAQAQVYALEMLQIHENALARDRVNSRPTIYTRVSTQLKQTGQSARPWFHAQHAQMVPSDVAGTVDFNTLIRSRRETMQRLDELTADTRSRENHGVDDKKHAELIVSDGRDMNETRHLPHDPAWMSWRTQQISHTISELWQVPPAAAGYNVNTERQAGASRLSEVVLLRWERHLRHFAALVVHACTLVGSTATLRNCLSHYDLHQIEAVAEPEYLREMYACVFGIDEAKLSLDRIKAWQESRIGGPSKTTSNNKTSEERAEQRTNRANGL